MENCIFFKFWKFKRIQLPYSSITKLKFLRKKDCLFTKLYIKINSARGFPIRYERIFTICVLFETFDC